MRMEEMIVQFSHANGFPGSSYHTMFTHLASFLKIDYIDCFGMHPDFPVGDSWDNLVNQLIVYIQEKHSQPVLGVGHSLGGVLTLLAANAYPELFKAVIMLDSPIPALWKANVINWLKKINCLHWFTPGRGKIQYRRDTWDNVEDVVSYLKTRGVYRKFAPECLWDFARYATYETPSGKRVLKISPQVELQIYQTLPHHFKDIMPGTLPNYAILSKNSRVVGFTDRRMMIKKFKFQIKWIAGGHLFPFEKPKETANVINHIAKELQGV